MENRIIFHIDFDYFYAQCEEIRNPELKTKPVAVCVFSDRGGDSGAIATANYTARKFGVKSGMPIKFAKNRLKEESNAVFLPTDFDYYSDISQNAMNIMKEYADVFEYVGRDEAYLDVTKKTQQDFEKAAHLAQQVKNIIREKVKLTCSIGVTPNKLLSKIASDYKKPDGLTIVTPEQVDQFLEPLKIRDIPGIGKKTEEKFSEMNIDTIGKLRTIDIFTLHQQFGRKVGTYIHNAARGIDDEPVAEREPSIQYSKIMTLKKDSNEFEFLLENLKELCKELHQVVLKNNRLFKSVGIQFFQSDLSQKTKSRMLRSPTSNLEELQKNAEQLLKDALQDQEKLVRRLGVKVSELSEIKGQSSMDSYF
ncbi:MAG: DNA polymerase IV [Nitrosopumilaceae archaeon]|nr:DNA polymerase IV [Nitrosopumilaceae archaeon]